MQRKCEICGKMFETRNCSLVCSDECRKKRNLEVNRKNTHRYTMKMKEEFFAHYGDKCVICGETDKHLLTIDHINNDGAEHRKRVGDNTYQVIKDLKMNGWPENYVQTMCYNCNNKKKMQSQTVDSYSYACVLRREVLNKLKPICSCCGVNDTEMLEIRPINGDIKGYMKKYKTRLSLLEAIKNDDEVSKQFEVLCVNCHRRLQYTGFRIFSKNKYLKVMVKE